MKRKIIIIGGGITGLSAAYLAARDGWEVTVLESSASPGGLMGTFQIGGNRLEHYYHHFFNNDEELLWLLNDLSISDQVELRKTTLGIYHKNKVYDFNGLRDLLNFSPLGITDKMRFLMSSVYLGKLTRWEKWEGVSALEWFYRYTGKRVTESIWKPLLEIKFGSHAGTVPASWMVGRLKQRMNSRKGKDEQLGYIKGSFQTLTDRLVADLRSRDVHIVVNAQVEKLLIDKNSIQGAITAQGTYHGGLFLATIPTTHLAPLLREGAPAYADELSKIKYFGAVCTILEMDRPLSDIYWINIADPEFPFGGVIEHTNFIPPDRYGGSHIVYLSRYYALNESIASATVKEIRGRMIAPLHRINPDFRESWIKNTYVFRTNSAATVCGLNYSGVVPRCKTPVSNLYVVNMSHIYPDERSCNNGIKIAARACKTIGIDTSMVPMGPSLSGQVGMD